MMNSAKIIHDIKIVYFKIIRKFTLKENVPFVPYIFKKIYIFF